MVINFIEIVESQYHHVKVTTNVKRSRDFVSEFYHADCNEDQVLVYCGYLKTLDPITKSAVLCLIDDDKVVKNILILGHSISQIDLSKHSEDALPASEVQRIIETDNSLKYNLLGLFQDDKKSPLTDEELRHRRDDIVNWLLKNRIPAECNSTTNEILIAGGSVRLRSPYTHQSNYVCPTRVVLKRVKQIVDSRPKESSLLIE